MVAGLKERREAYKEMLASGATTFRTMEETAMKTAEVVGRVNEIDELIQLMLEDSADGTDE